MAGPLVQDAQARHGDRLFRAAPRAAGEMSGAYSLLLRHADGTYEAGPHVVRQVLRDIIPLGKRATRYALLRLLLQAPLAD